MADPKNLAGTADLATVQQLERENAELKRQLVVLAPTTGRRALTSLRAITLDKENNALRELIAIAKHHGV